MIRFTLLKAAAGVLLALSCVLINAADAPAPVCDCKPMTVSVRAAGVRATSDIAVKNFLYGNAALKVTVGDTVTWTNNDSAPHTATSDNGVFDTGTLTSGMSGSFTFTSAGTFPYHCTIHPFMTGVVIVEQPSPPTLKNLAVSATVGVAFKYTITADGTKPITFGATLPDGLQLNGAQITGTFAAAGRVTIPLTAANSIGQDAQNLVVTVVERGGSNLSGTWTGKLKSKHFNQIGASAKASTQTVSLTITQTGGTLSAALTLAGDTEASTLAGQTGNLNLWLTGNNSTQSLIFSAHLSKKADSMSGIGILTTLDGDEEVMLSLKKH